MIQIDNLPRFLHYNQEMLVNMNREKVKMFCQKNTFQKKATTMKKSEYLSLGSELKNKEDDEANKKPTLKIFK